MKKILFIIILAVGLLFPANIIAQRNCFYLCTGDAFVNTGLAFMGNSDDGYSNLSQYSELLSLGTGFRLSNGSGLECNLFYQGTYFKNDGGSSVKGLGLTFYLSSEIVDNIHWSWNLSYRRIWMSEISGSDGFHDLLFEPCVFEYMTSNGHWGFRLSVISIETAFTFLKDTDLKKESFLMNSKDKTGYAINFNKFPIQIAYYF